MVPNTTYIPFRHRIQPVFGAHLRRKQHGHPKHGVHAAKMKFSQILYYKGHNRFAKICKHASQSRQSRQGTTDSLSSTSSVRTMDHGQSAIASQVPERGHGYATSASQVPERGMDMPHQSCKFQEGSWECHLRPFCSNKKPRACLYLSIPILYGTQLHAIDSARLDAAPFLTARL